MLKFWIIVVYIEDRTAIDGEYPTVLNNQLYTQRKNAEDDFAHFDSSKVDGVMTKIELVECISNKILSSNRS